MRAKNMKGCELRASSDFQMLLKARGS